MSQSFYSVLEYPKLKKLVDHWDVIRDEFSQLDVPILDIDRVDKSHEQVLQEITQHVDRGGEYGWLKGWDYDGTANEGWLQYGLIVHDQKLPFVQGMEKTLALLSDIKGIKVCALSKMMPHVYLRTHTHPEVAIERLLQFHLTLDMDSENRLSYLNVNGEFYRNKCGEAIIFDGSQEHFALNASSKDRTILYIEFKRDLLFEGNEEIDI